MPELGSHPDDAHGDHGVVLAQLRLEARYGEIKIIARNSGTNLLEGNLNPKVDSPD